MIKLLDLLEMANIIRKGRSKILRVGDIKLKNLKLKDVTGNIVTYYAGPKNNLFGPGFYIAYFMDSDESARALKANEIDMIFFPHSSINMYGSSPITDIWKRNKRQRGKKHILGVVTAYINEEKKTLWIDKLSVRSNSRRNNIGTFLINAVKKEWSGYGFFSSKTTNDGTKFFSSFSDDEKPEIDK